jgi:hypothetical protein
MANNTAYEQLVKSKPGTFVERIVTEVLNKDTVEVHFDADDDEPAAVIKIHIYDEDIEMAVCLLTEGKWVLQFGYYDDEDDFHEIHQPLTQTDIDVIPKGLQKVMLKVLVSEEGLRVPGDFLSRTKS